MEKPPKSRLDREIDEILEKKMKEPIPFRPRQQTQGRHPNQTSPLRQQAERAWQWLSSMPLAMAYAFVFLAILVHDASPLLALLLCTAAVVAIWYPGIRRLLKPASAATPDVKYWRGRPYASEIKSAVSRSPVDSLKRYFDRRR
jgi:hypothetical protein